MQRIKLPKGDRETLMPNIETVVANTEDLLRRAGSTKGKRNLELRKIKIALRRLKEVREKVADTRVVVAEKCKKAARATDDYVYERPWTSIGIAAAVGVLAGLLTNRK
jgi:ElaB/YqjD/DUF883 family membrane-anchored ribosome-binding protein